MRNISDFLCKKFKYYVEFERGFAHNTYLAYMRDVKQFIEFMGSKGKTSCVDFTQDDVVAYLVDLSEKKYADSSRCRKLMSVREFFKFLVLEDEIPKNPIKEIECPIRWKKIPEFLTVNEMMAILNSCDISNELGSRNRAFMELLYATGLRVSEACQLDRNDIQDGMVKVKGKGVKERLVPVCEVSRKYIERYLLEYRNDQNPWIFQTEKKNRLERVNAYKIIKYQARKAGLNKRTTPHTIRHTFASHLLQNGADIRVIQEMMGHESISMTYKYLHVNDEHIANSFYKHHPRG